VILARIQQESAHMLSAMPVTREGLRKCLLCLISSSVFAGVELLLELADALFFAAGKLRLNFNSGGLHSVRSEKPHLTEDRGD